MSFCYRCVGWSADTTVNFKQNGISISTVPLEFMGVIKVSNIYVHKYGVVCSYCVDKTTSIIIARNYSLKQERKLGKFFLVCL